MRPCVRFPPVMRSGATRRRIRRLVVDLERRGDGQTIEGPLRTALGDEALQVAFWLPDRSEWVDAEGHRVELPRGEGARTVTQVGGPAGPLAAIVHDARLRRDRRLLQAVVAAARLALENERLEAELRVSIAEVRASRARIVAAGDAERRRIERDLHDGAQQRLVSLSLGMQMVAMRLGEHRNGKASQLLDHGIEVTMQATEELRRIAQGIFPAALSEEGLAAALEDLAVAAPIPVELAATPERRVGETAEAAAYFAAAAAIATAARHDPKAGARLATRITGDQLELTVEPISGNHPDLRSLDLEDRVEALGGTVTSDAGSLRVAIPIAGEPA